MTDPQKMDYVLGIMAFVTNLTFFGNGLFGALIAQNGFSMWLSYSWEFRLLFACWPCCSSSRAIARLSRKRPLRRKPSSGPQKTRYLFWAAGPRITFRPSCSHKARHAGDFGFGRIEGNRTMTCYPCNLCNKCGQFDAVRALWGKCPGCGGDYDSGDRTCANCGHVLPIPPGMSASGQSAYLERKMKDRG